MKKLKWAIPVLILIFIITSIPEWMYENSGESTSIGSVRNGRLENAYLIPYRGKNFRYFSLLSYYVFNNGYTHSKVYRTVLQAYKICEKKCPNTYFRYMECSDKSGGRLLVHRTHQNGMSVDFMVPKTNKTGNQSTILDHIGMWHYLLEFNNKGHLRLNKSVRIDFEAIGRHIIALDDAAKDNGLRIRKIILNTALIDDLYATESGKQVRSRGIFIVPALSEIVNKVHDDHYHIDFQEI